MNKIKVRADMFCKLFAASCGVDSGELIEVSQKGCGVEFKVRILHCLFLLGRTNSYYENRNFSVDLEVDSDSRDIFLNVRINDSDLVGCCGFKALEMDEDTMKFIYVNFFSSLGILEAKPENISIEDFEDGDYDCHFVMFTFYDEMLSVDKRLLDFVGIEMRFDVAENNGVAVMVSEDEDVYPFFGEDIDRFIEQDKYYFDEDDERYGEH